METPSKKSRSTKLQTMGTRRRRADGTTKALPRNSQRFVGRLKPKHTPQAGTAAMVMAGLASNAILTNEWSRFPFGDVDLTACMDALVESAERVKQRDLSELEALLMAQAMALNAVFSHLSHRAALNMGEHLDAMDRYMRLALKAQGQSRATIETLAAIQNPQIVFAHQANIAHGPQQVNNGALPPGVGASRRAGNPKSTQIRVLEAHEERLDSGSASTAGTCDQAMATLGKIDRPAKR